MQKSHVQNNIALKCAKNMQIGAQLLNVWDNNGEPVEHVRVINNDVLYRIRNGLVVIHSCCSLSFRTGSKLKCKRRFETRYV